jgi:serine/threonine protein kinase/formylglycine-generating enzyme required for sulfatase activity
MDKDTWKQIEDLFHQALELPVRARSKFVEQAAKGDSQLKFEVLTLLSSHDTDSSLLESGSHLSEAVSALTKQLVNEEASVRSAASSSSSPSSGSSGDAKLVKMIEAAREDFVVKRTISRGGMGVVFRVYQRKLDRDVAVKVLSASHLDDRARRRFVRESKAVAQVKNDHVVQVYEVCQDEAIPFLVMELIDGPSLKRYIELNQRVEPRVAAELTRQVAVGLDSAHQKNLIHRDIKPANILLEPLRQESQTQSRESLEFRARVVDFGLARDIDDPTGETQDQLFAGTLAYMSPEQITSPAAVDFRSDIYSLGMTLYQMLTGEKPFLGAPHMVIKKIQGSEPTAPRKLDDRIPKDLESICLKALQKDGDRRYQTAKEMTQDLDRYLDGLPTLARPISTQEKVGRWIKRNRKIAALTGLTASLLIALTLGSMIFALTVRNKNQQIVQQTTLAKTSQLQRIIDSDPAALDFALNDVAPDDQQLLQSLEREFENPERDFNSRFNAAIALSQLGQPRTQFIVENLGRVYVSPANCRNVVLALKVDPKAKSMLRTAMDLQTDIQLRARHIIVLAALDEFGPWKQAVLGQFDLSLCTEIIHQYPSWHGDLVEFVRILEAQDNKELDWTFCHAISLMDSRSFNHESRQTVVQWLQSQTSSSPYVNVASARLVLNRWGLKDKIDSTHKKSEAWYELPNGICLTRVEPSTSTMGRIENEKDTLGYPPHDVKITRPFFIADTETTVRQYEEFLNEPKEQPEGRPAVWDSNVTVSPTEDHPANRVSFYDAARFCNWLSRKEGLTPVYQFRPGTRAVQLEGGEVGHMEDWQTDRTANGFRLPSEHEWELACRDKTTTPYFFGTEREYYSDYGLKSNRTRIPAGRVRSRLPNRIGIFDIHGNVWELCDDWYTDLDESFVVDPVGPEQPEPRYFRKVHRGGGVATISGDSDAEARGSAEPEARYNNLGFRVARFIE